MKKVGSLKVGDTAIYISEFTVKVSKVVEKPIDDGISRPDFKIGRKDLANGDYLINGGNVYDSPEEAANALIESIKKTKKDYENKKLLAEGMIVLLDNKLKLLGENISA
jgi:hypothetical protein